jgi:hypothetical protein
MTMWDTLDVLVDRATDSAGLRAHGVHLLAARHWRAEGRPVPCEIVDDETFMAMALLSVPVLLARLRETIDGPIVVLKGPEIAARYPDPALRPFVDLDVLVASAPDAQSALIARGFQSSGASPFYVEHYHRSPLRWPGLPLAIELHDAPGWPVWMHPPRSEELVERAVPSATSVDGIFTLSPDDHAVFLAAHAWNDGPLGRMLNLVDVAVMADGLDGAELAALADRWGMGRVWKTTLAAVDQLVTGHIVDPRSLPIWARHLRLLRQRTVLEAYLVGWLGNLWAPSFPSAARGLIWTGSRSIRPFPGESRTVKLRRLTQTARHLRSPAADYRNKD